MSSLTYTHAMLLSMQLASVFKYVADSGIHRESYNKFTTLEGEHGDIIKVEFLAAHKGRSTVDAYVNSDRNGFRFRQHFNYGILLELEVGYLNSDGVYKSILEAVHNKSEDDAYLTELMIDFEYAISIFTEHVAVNVDIM